MAKSSRTVREQPMNVGREAPAKARRAPLTRERIIHAALWVMDEEGLESVTMRRLGRELGVEAMSLYNHVQDKEDILDGICEQVMAEFQFPPIGDDWAENVRLGARAWRRLLQAHPNVIRLFAERRAPARSTDSLRPMEFALRILRDAGLSPRDAVQAFHAFGGYIEGFVIMDMGQMPGDENLEREHQELANSPAFDELPTLREVFPHFHECDSDEQFEFGLELLIEGLRARNAEPRR